MTVTVIGTEKIGESGAEIMSAVVMMPPQKKTLKDPELKRKLQQLRPTDNWTNWLYLGRAYLIIALAIATAVTFRHWQISQELSFWWNVPIYLLAIIVIGASQHQLAGATHEATHHILFRNRWLNELTSDWLCMFPLFSSTYVFRLHHLAHHQFINDPERDPDFSQLRLSGHWLDFPVTKKFFLGRLMRQFLILPLLTYLLVRAQYNAIGVDNNPYFDKSRRFSKWPMRWAMAYLFGSLVAHWIICNYFPAIPRLLLGVGLGYLAVNAALLLIPANRYTVARLRPLISPRIVIMSRVLFVTLIFTSLSVIQIMTGKPAWNYFLLLWIVPLFTSFSFFMILRQLVQHGNGDRGKLTNTRVFLVNPFIRYAVFPFGMDYHLPHHVFATIPHYRLPQLHAVMQDYPEYNREGIVVEGYFRSPHSDEDRNPTVLEVLGPKYAKRGDEVFEDPSVVDGMMDHESKLSRM